MLLQSTFLKPIEVLVKASFSSYLHPVLEAYSMGAAVTAYGVDLNLWTKTDWDGRDGRPKGSLYLPCLRLNRWQTDLRVCTTGSWSTLFWAQTRSSVSDRQLLVVTERRYADVSLLPSPTAGTEMRGFVLVCVYLLALQSSQGDIEPPVRNKQQKTDTYLCLIVCYLIPPSSRHSIPFCQKCLTPPPNRTLNHTTLHLISLESTHSSVCFSRHVGWAGVYLASQVGKIPRWFARQRSVSTKTRRSLNTMCI